MNITASIDSAEGASSAPNAPCSARAPPRSTGSPDTVAKKIEELVPTGLQSLPLSCCRSGRDEPESEPGNDEVPCPHVRAPWSCSWKRRSESIGSARFEVLVGEAERRFGERPQHGSGTNGLSFVATLLARVARKLNACIYYWGPPEYRIGGFRHRGTIADGDEPRLPRP